MTSEQTDQYDKYYERLAKHTAGEPIEFHPDDPPEPGFYRWKNKDGSLEPVSIWIKGNGVTLTAKIGDKIIAPEKIETIWQYVQEHPIPYDLFESVMAGGLWPGEVEGIDMTPEAVKDKAKEKTRGIGDNNPPEEHERLEFEITDVARAIKEALAGKLETKTDADTLANLRDKSNDLWKKADALRKAEREPHKIAGEAVQARWADMLGIAKRAADSARGPISKLIDQLSAIKANALRAASPEMTQEEIEEASKTRVGGRMGKRVATKKVKHAVIDDYDLLIAEIKNYDQIRELAQKIATKVIRAGGTLPGVSMTETNTAV